MDSTEYGLLETFNRNQSEDAFRDLVARHLSMVYHTALRSTNDATIAEDVSQQVFTILARKASRLKPGFGLGGWLHRVTVYESAKAMRAENRRSLTMKEYANRQSLSSTENSLQESIRPCLDDAINSLSESDRQAIIMRFFGGYSFQDIAKALGKNQNAAQKQVSRAVGKIARRLDRYGFGVGIASLGSMLLVEGSKAVPTDLLGPIAHRSLARASSLTTSTNFFVKLATTTKIKTKISISLAVLSGALVGLYVTRNPRIEVDTPTPPHVSSVKESGTTPLIEPAVRSPPAILPRLEDADTTDDGVAKAKVGARGLRNGIRQFHLQYGNYLAFSGSSSLEVDFSVSSDAVTMAILLGIDRDRNPRGIQFGDWGADSSNGIVTSVGSQFDGSFVDPWGIPYIISIDGDGDGRIPDPADTENMLKKVIVVYSAGPDGDFRTWHDNVTASM